MFSRSKQSRCTFTMQRMDALKHLNTLPNPTLPTTKPTMRAIQSLAFLACLSTVSASSGRHAAHNGLLQIPPSFAHDDIHMYPALHPEHDPVNLRHLTPEDSQDLYYSQEGHRRQYTPCM